MGDVFYCRSIGPLPSCYPPLEEDEFSWRLTASITLLEIGTRKNLPFFVRSPARVLLLINMNIRAHFISHSTEPWEDKSWLQKWGLRPKPGCWPRDTYGRACCHRRRQTHSLWPRWWFSAAPWWPRLGGWKADKRFLLLPEAPREFFLICVKVGSSVNPSSRNDWHTCHLHDHEGAETFRAEVDNIIIEIAITVNMVRTWVRTLELKEIDSTA